MKELTIEQKAKAYDKALERAKEWLNLEEPDSYTCIVESIFPELIEDEDEKIRKEIINFLELPHPQFVGNRNHEDWIAWLEKQGKPVEINPTEFDKIEDEPDPENFKRQIMSEMCDLVKDYIQQKHAWSEKDDYNLQCMIAKVISDIQNGNVGRNQELIDWLKSLKERYTLKPSEKQMHAFEQVYDWYNNNFAPSETLTRSITT